MVSGPREAGCRELDANMKDTYLRSCPPHSKSGVSLSFQGWAGSLPHTALPGSRGDRAQAMKTLLPGHSLQGSPPGPLQPWRSPWGYASWCAFGYKQQLFAQIDDLLGRIGWYFTKPKGEKFSLASEELESGTAKSCMPVAALPSLTASLPLSPPSSGQFSVRGSTQPPLAPTSHHRM